MDTSAEIKRALIKALGITPNLAITATVVSIENDTCTVKLLSELVLSDVRLKATISDDEDSFLIIPKVDSEVILMSQTGELSGLMVLKVNEVAKIKYKQGDTEFIVDSEDGKFQLKNGDTNLKNVFESLADILKQLKVSTGMGPSGTPLPDNIIAIEQWQQEYGNLLK